MIYETSLYVLATNGAYQFASDNYNLFFSDNNCRKLWTIDEQETYMV